MDESLQVNPYGSQLYDEVVALRAQVSVLQEANGRLRDRVIEVEKESDIRGQLIAATPTPEGLREARGQTKKMSDYANELFNEIAVLRGQLAEAQAGLSRMIWASNPGIMVPPESALGHVDAAVNRLVYVHEKWVQAESTAKLALAQAREYKEREDSVLSEMRDANRSLAAARAENAALLEDNERFGKDMVFHRCVLGTVKPYAGTFCSKGCKDTDFNVLAALRARPDDGRVERVVVALDSIGVRHGDTAVSSLVEIARAVLAAADGKVKS